MAGFLSVQNIASDVLAYVFPDRGWIMQDMSTSSTSFTQQLMNALESRFFIFDDVVWTGSQEYVHADATMEEPENDYTDFHFKKPLTGTLTITISGNYINSILSKFFPIDRIEGMGPTIQKMIINSKYEMLKEIADSGKPVDLIYNGRVIERMVFDRLSDAPENYGNDMTITADLSRKSYMDSRQIVVDGQLQASSKKATPFNKSYSDFMNSGAMKIVEQVSSEITETLLAVV